MIEMMFEQLEPRNVVLAPTGLLDLAATVVQVRGTVALARERRHTMTTVAQQLVEGGQASEVIHRDPHGGEWSVKIVPSAAGDTGA